MFGNLFHSLSETLFSRRINVNEGFPIDLSKRTYILDKFYTIAKKNNEKPSGETITDYYFQLPVDEKCILMVGLGKNVRGNMQSILNELNSSDKFEGFHIFVRTSPETDEIVKGYITQNNWTRTKTVKNNRKYNKLMESAKYLITEVYFPESWTKKPGQVYINIWHGTPLKRLGLAKKFKTSHKNGVAQKNFIDADYLLYPNEYTKKNMLASYKVASLMKGKTLLLGYPRTGSMMKAAQEDYAQIHEILAPKGERVYAYMPTFKDYLKTEELVAECSELLNYLDAMFQDDQILYVNLHHKVSDSIDYSVFRHIRKFPPLLDSYRLLAATDALISDYSSVFFDYLALKKQIILYVPDYKLYAKKRGTYMNLMDLPFDKALTKEEVLTFLNQGKTYSDEEVWNTFCAYDSPENAKKLCQLIANDETGLNLEALPADERTKLLIYTDACAPGASTSLLYDFAASCDKSTTELFFSTDAENADGNRDSAYPLFFENCVIGIEGQHLSSTGAAIRKLYLNNMVTFGIAIKYLQYDYAVSGKRMYGQADFSMVIIYDVDNPDRILALTEMPAPKILFIQDSVLEQINSGNHFLKDSICFAAKYSKYICLASESQKEKALQILNSSVEPRMKIVASADDLLQLLV